MISVEEAQARLFALASPLPEEIVSLAQAIGRWSSRPVVAERTQPSRHLSAMDGYALAHAGLPGPFKVIGESAAGAGYRGTVKPGEAVRIFTGAPLPAGADTVIMQEDASRDGEMLTIDASLQPPYGHHVRPAGSDFAQTSVLIEAGERLTPARIALAAMGGHGQLSVRRLPRITILATGNELVPAGTQPGDDQIPESNAIMLAAMLRDYPCTITTPGIIPDDLDALTRAITASDGDILVTLGGASVGDHDLVRPALETCGASLDFWKIAMRPGKPVFAGKRGAQVVLGLPGNPVSAFVTAFLFLRPMVAALSGARHCLPPRSSAALAEPLAANGNRTDHLRAVLESGMVTPIGLNDSAALLGLSRANALIVRAPGAPPAKAGDPVEIISLA